MSSLAEKQDSVITISSIAMAGKADLLEEAILQYPQLDAPVEHKFGPGLYMREVTLPAGSYVVGHYQKTEHMNIMLKGRIIFVLDDGTKKELVAPLTMVTPPGRKVAYVVEETTWVNVYPTEETDIDVLEATYLDKSEAFLSKESEKFLEAGAASESERADFQLMLEHIGMEEGVVRELSVYAGDMVDMPDGVHPYRIAKSPIEGSGYFLTAPAEMGDILAPGRIGECRTPAGRYVNHSPNPNAAFMRSPNDGEIYLVSLRHIDGCVGGSVGGEVTVNYREAIKLVRGESCHQ